MEIHRQHEDTRIPELESAIVTKLLAAGPGKDVGFYVFYMQANEVWYRFFIDCDILFWTTQAPDSDDDLGEGEHYTDVVAHFGISEKAKLGRVTMENGCLSIEFPPHRSLEFRIDRKTEAIKIS